MSAWNPTPARLRDGQAPDVSAHAARNIAQVRMAEHDGYFTKEEADEHVDRILSEDQ